MPGWAEKLSKMTQNAVTKSKYMAEITRINIEISNHESSLKQQISEIGQYVVDNGLLKDDANIQAKLERIAELQAQSKKVEVICIGKKARDILNRKFSTLIVKTYEGISRKGADFDEAIEIFHPILQAFEKGVYDKVEIVSSFFKSAISRETKSRAFLPINFDDSQVVSDHPINMAGNAFYDYEPDKEEMLSSLLIMMLKAQLFNALVQAQASEQGSRMASMDNATRNASDMISKLTLRYNGIRQSAITTELTEIISGAEAI